MHVCSRYHRAVRQPGVLVHAYLQRHAEVPLLALAGLVHLRIACTAVVLGGAGRGDDGGFHDGAGADLQAAGLQHLADLCKQRLAKLVFFQATAKLQQRRACASARF